MRRSPLIALLGLALYATAVCAQGSTVVQAKAVPCAEAAPGVAPAPVNNLTAQALNDTAVLVSVTAGRAAGPHLHAGARGRWLGSRHPGG